MEAIQRKFGKQKPETEHLGETWLAVKHLSVAGTCRQCVMHSPKYITVSCLPTMHYM